ncbi:TonB-dependent siderophore receptor [Methylocapsa sp. D3K7]|uniref:TonB-dependent receptor n=1 Tax=Methylocapsa sp. D3K7 TaxID=3041435 RepID=UPI00244EDC80|nr:TonB-dependent siderophore receptor [Methylocapsa sp. D3K7]WGJ13130.1 TonB-dependent siderophore receptor [Methylocapsa sp. D3K7]
MTRESTKKLAASERTKSDRSPSKFILAKARAPVARAVIGLGSVMYAGAAAPQEASQEVAQDTDQEVTQDVSRKSPRKTESTSAGTITLDPVDVVAGTGGGSDYNPRTLGLNRIPTPILDTPQSITVVPQQLIQDQQDSTVVETLRNVPGVTFFGGEGGTQGDNIAIRGYSARNDFYRDGVRDPGWYTRDTFSVQNVEVLKGPSSFLFGRGSTGGVINMTSKLPLFATFGRVDMSGYTAEGGRVVADVNQVFGDSAARIVLLGNDTNAAGRDHVVTKRVGAAPSIIMNMTDATRVTLSYLFQKDDNVPDYGIPLLPGSYFGTSYGQPAPVPKNTYYGQLTSENPDREEVDAHIITARIDHEINPGWLLSNVTRYSYIDRFVRVRGTQVGNQVSNGSNLFDEPFGGTRLNPVPFMYPVGGLWINNTNNFQNHTQNSLFTNQSDLVGHFDTGFLHHLLLAGVELSQETRSHFRTTLTPGDRVNVALPNPYPFFAGSLPTNSTLQDDIGRTIGMYANDQVKITDYFELLGGLRYDLFKVWQFAATENTLSRGVVAKFNAATPFNISNEVNFLSWRAGAVAHPVENSSIYFMYGTSFDPSSAFLTIAGGQQDFAPTTSQVAELGAKMDLLDSRLSLTSALFQVTQENAIETINSAAGLYAQVGTTRVKGVEFGIAGKLTEAWSIFGGYTYMDGRVLESARNAAGTAFISTPGNQIANVPHNTFALTSTYAITPALTVGGSVYYVGSRFTTAADIGRVPGYWRFDLLGNYKIDETFSLQANIYNIADTKNFETITGFGAAIPGPGRSAILTARMAF